MFEFICIICQKSQNSLSELDKIGRVKCVQSVYLITFSKLSPKCSGYFFNRVYRHNYFLLRKTNAFTILGIYYTMYS